MVDEKKQLIELKESPDYKISCLSIIKDLMIPKLNIDDAKEEHGNIRFKEFNSNENLIKLRKLMKLNKLSCYIVPSEDEHASEYTSLKDKRREFISGFTGSSGIAIITSISAALSTDSRYFLQAENQLDSNWFLIKQGLKNYPIWYDWMINECIYLKDNFSNETGNIGIDPKLINYNIGKKLINLTHLNNLNLVLDLNYNLIDSIRGNLNIPINKIYEFPFKFNGLLTNNKIDNVRNLMINNKCFVYITNMLDSIAWLLNLRGSDIKFNPVFFSYLIIYLDKIILYIDKKKLNIEILNYLKNFNILIKPYNQIWDDLPSINNKFSNKNFNNIFIDNNSSYSIYINLPSIYEIKFKSFITELKGIKNQIEINNLKISQKIDSFAIIKFLSWINKLKLNNEIFQLNEINLVNKLFKIRSLNNKFKGNSFSSIIATGSNSSIIHYEPTNENNSLIKSNNLLLLDIGGQYFEGTTDITRTIYLFKDKKPTNEIKRNYTLVLKGHLNIAMLKFKFGTSSYYIDELGRKPLKKFGLNYGHGTGHGIDNFLNVHSGPCGLSPNKTSYNYKPLEYGNFISDEPGYYKDNEYGIRIESDILVINEKEGDLLKFDYLTLVPFCNELIDINYLNDQEIQFINEYHERIFKTFESELENDKDFKTLDWLREATMPI